MECVIKINTFDNTRPVAANAQRVPRHMFEMIPDAAVVMFARLPQGDGVFLRNSSAQDEVVEKKKRAVVEGKKKHQYLFQLICENT